MPRPNRMQPEVSMIAVDPTASDVTSHACIAKLAAAIMRRSASPRSIPSSTRRMTAAAGATLTAGAAWIAPTHGTRRVTRCAMTPTWAKRMLDTTDMPLPQIALAALRNLWSAANRIAS